MKRLIGVIALVYPVFVVLVAIVVSWVAPDVFGGQAYFLVMLAVLPAFLMSLVFVLARSGRGGVMSFAWLGLWVLVVTVAHFLFVMVRLGSP